MLRNDLIALLLVGGRGTRLGELGNNKPKCLINVAGKTILEHQLDLLLLNGIQNVFLCTGYLSDQVVEAAKNLPYPYKMMKIIISDETLSKKEVCGTAGALSIALKRLAALHVRPSFEEAFVVMNGDVFCPELKIPDPKDDMVQIAVHEYAEPYGRVIHHIGTSVISEFREKKKHFISSGVYIFGKNTNIEVHPWVKDNEVSLEYETWQRLTAGKYMRSFCYNGPWFDLGTPERIRECTAWIESRKS